MKITSLGRFVPAFETVSCRMYENEPSDIDNSQLTEMMSVMFEQAEEIRKELPITAEDMSNIVVNYLAQTGLDEKAQELLRKLCLQIIKGTK